MKNEEEILNILTKRNVRLPQHCISILLSKEKERKREERKREKDVLACMVVTLDVSHRERLPLNAEAKVNAITKETKDKKYTEKERK